MVFGPFVYEVGVLERASVPCRDADPPVRRDIAMREPASGVYWRATANRDNFDRSE
jgi:hypothetical protein